MLNQIATVTAKKQFKCFSCGQEITFKGSKTKYNLDGTVHVCPEGQQRERRHYKDNSSSARQNRWYWGFGPGKYHKDNEKRYSGEEYKQRRKAADEQRKQWKNQYSNTESNYTQEKALEILELTTEVLKLRFEERIQTIKVAYRRLALKFHPDRRPDGNQQKFVEVTAAYEKLVGTN